MDGSAGCSISAIGLESLSMACMHLVRREERLFNLIRFGWYLLQREGVASVVRRAFQFSSSWLFQWKAYYVFRVDLRNATRYSYGTGRPPDVPNLRMEIVQSNEQADVLEREGLEFRSQSFQATGRLAAGAIAVCIWSEHRLVHIRWAGMSQSAMKLLQDPPYHVDFAAGEFVSSGAWTHPAFRRKGLSEFARHHTHAYMRDVMGYPVLASIQRKKNIAAVLQTHMGMRGIREEGRHLHLLWWDWWWQKPLPDEGQLWNDIALRANGGSDVIGAHKRRMYERLMTRWMPDLPTGWILKTDLFGEAFGEGILSSSFDGYRLLGMDVASHTVRQAHSNDGQYEYCVANVKTLPLQKDVLSLVISDSTLDHFRDLAELAVALKEVVISLRPGGVMVLTLDNPGNPTRPPYWAMNVLRRLGVLSILMRFMGLAPYTIGRTLSPGRLNAMLTDFGMQVEAETAIAHYPVPYGMLRPVVCLTQSLAGNTADRWIEAVLNWSDRLEGWPTKYITGRYIAVKAVKRC